MIAIHFLNYNFVRKHTTIKDAPAVAAGVVDKALTIEEMVEMFDEFRDENYPIDRPKRYKKRSTVPRSFEPVAAPKTPWYLNPNSAEAQAKYEEIRKKNSN